jgi:hypothetical protein
LTALLPTGVLPADLGSGKRHRFARDGTNDGIAVWRQPTIKTKSPSQAWKLGKHGEVRAPATLEDVPSVGPAIAADLRRLGIKTPADLPHRDPYAMYDDLCRITGQRHDPFVLDTFIAAVRFTEGEPKKPRWKYTAERKKALAARNSG